ncbi:MAG: hypothetical protein KZQ66_12120, partial [Candidatus Thiodiazotropha sp. (ex Lucinoma aequizonata)]|nr:hypothetical protein [Candidatus Thiodiazotropha sp. (ex Lucinoma aequizonata)]MCU7896712.1 hypothetical protein [Candidatus Thiodiazotropha sp. (ex Lucinoma aequizonata)]MCU7900411.1 hypothetical protein [Candidatus Thiodiazotropha sp. (ex Lucinoma aequizonata)]MCU7902640.1 hypothetical protein [Candidatus Thiodiazotropha sp. (ex Lucinoma aequizonata)]MCU7911409.1 hypothetical protein [Candidatus Thiodiazotropha sp. (ex Lucinoma aequizonata)]
LSLSVAIPAIQPRLRLSGTNRLRSAFHGGQHLKEDSSPAYFAQKLLVYGKSGEPCPSCGSAIRRKNITQRSTFFCANCQH